MSILLENSVIHFLQTSFACMIPKFITVKILTRAAALVHGQLLSAVIQDIAILSNSHKGLPFPMSAPNNESYDEKRFILSKTSHYFCNCQHFPHKMR